MCRPVEKVQNTISMQTQTQQNAMIKMQNSRARQQQENSYFRTSVFDRLHLSRAFSVGSGHFPAGRSVLREKRANYIHGQERGTCPPLEML